LGKNIDFSRLRKVSIGFFQTLEKHPCRHAMAFQTLKKTHALRRCRFQGLEDFSADETIEETDEYSDPALMMALCAPVTIMAGGILFSGEPCSGAQMAGAGLILSASALMTGLKRGPPVEQASGLIEEPSG